VGGACREGGGRSNFCFLYNQQEALVARETSLREKFCSVNNVRIRKNTVQFFVVADTCLLTIQNKYQYLYY
jgi:hypothetical protein